ncbi:MAG: sulfatase-like hydrolase/transferase [Planctomycetes bacterium]|nr:sulfatase-like hydrolase/transferase [Planctomycetota bacterium]
MLFSKAVTPAAVTLPAHASMLTGLFPLNHGARANSRFRLQAENRTLAEILAEHGYQTGAAVSAFVLDSRFGIDQGFEEFNDDVVEEDEKGLGIQYIPERPADETNAWAVTWLREHAGGPFFLWVHYYDPHKEWQAPQPYADQHKLAYDAEIAFADAQFGELLDVLDELGLTDSTLVVAVGDHGEGLFQHDEGTHSFLIYDSTMHVPLAMRCGTRLGGGVHIDLPVSLVDIMPTTLSLLGIDVPPDLDGEDLTQPPTSDRLLFFEAIQPVADYGWAAVLGVGQGSMKYIYGAGEEELYDLSADPFELTNLVSDRPQVASAMKKRLHEFFGEDLDNPGSIRPTERLTADEIAKLAALGYVDMGVEDLPAADRPHPRKMMRPLSRALESTRVEREEGPEAAIEWLEAIIEEHPGFAVALERLADAYYLNDQPDEAEAVLKELLAARSGAAQPLLLLARFNKKQGRTDAAVKLYNQVLEKVPEDYGTMMELARMLLVHERYAEAADLLFKALPLRPRDPALPDVLLTTMKQVGRGDEAFSLLTRQLEKEPNLPAMRSAVAHELAGQQRFGEAVQLLRDGIELAPEDHSLRHNLALILVGGGDEELFEPFEAQLLLENICQETGYKDPRYLQTLAWVYSRRARVDEAISVAEKAYEIASTSELPEFSRLAPKIGRALQGYKQARDRGVNPMMKRPATQPADHESHNHDEKEADAG